MLGRQRLNAGQLPGSERCSEDRLHICTAHHTRGHAPRLAGTNANRILRRVIADRVNGETIEARRDVGNGIDAVRRVGHRGIRAILPHNQEHETQSAGSCILGRDEHANECGRIRVPSRVAARGRERTLIAWPALGGAAKGERQEKKSKEVHGSLAA